ncbi:peptidoglycan D,D-transpeptidase FtsI family protein [Anaerostipes sp.]|uniref:peptidoglycan D,D-transpeptidase FtsI family protein n=1 Tax=Anaerostipes sp. TaxID=1872530 RepID=UPI0025797A3E|nr:penicillin-binding transpeptidase domain-containing protein [Anaerostipes sp.]
MKTGYKKKILGITGLICLGFSVVAVRLGYVMIAQSDKYQELARDLHQREREIKAPRGNIYDRNGVKIASNKAVYSISVIYSQMTDKKKVVQVLSEELGLETEEIKGKVYKNSVREKIKSNVEKETADRIREYKLDGVKVDEDYKRVYPYDSLASKVLGFTGGDNQGIVGLEVFYDKYLKGKSGKILTLTDGKGIEIEGAYEERDEPVAGNDLYTSLDVNLQNYVTQACEKVKKEKNAKQVSMILMNPQNGEIYAMANVPEYNLNEPFKLNSRQQQADSKKQQEYLNQKWRNSCINDTYEPGSVFKIVTAAAGLESGKVKVTDHFNCQGFRIVEDRKIRCHKTTGHGSETFREGVMNSCNPVFMEVGARVGVDGMYDMFRKLGLFEKTGIDLPGEANSIMHKKKNVKAVELATMSFGQSIQITPLQLLRAASAAVNGGKLITPHFGVRTVSADGKKEKIFEYPEKKGVIQKETSETLRDLLKAVVSEGSGRNCKIEGFSIGGKTATSEKLPRGNGKYISSFLGFSKAEDPTVMGIVLIDEPEGTYYGGTIAAPVMRSVFQVALPYLGISKDYTAEKENE